MLVKRNFYSCLFEYNSIPKGYKAIGYKNSNDIAKVTKAKNTKIYSYQYAPDYLNYKVNADLKYKKVFQKKGYAVNLSDCDSVENYISKYCKTNFRGNIRRPLKRLESCFNISYKMFYGFIDKDEYTYLMDVFHSMLKKRFEQRNDKNIILDNWDFYLTHAYQLIIKKKASLFVVYNNDEPIAFALSFVFDKVFYFAIPTFNLDYSKFTLGNTVIYKNLEWCFENNFQLFDMGYGGFENKLNWCNTSYNFNHHILYNPKNIFGNLYAEILKYKYKTINYLLSKDINRTIKKLKSKSKNTAKNEFGTVYISSKIENTSDFNKNALLQIDFLDEEYKYLRKPIYDFLYLNIEHIDAIKVYKLKNTTQDFLVKGKSKNVKISITN